MVGSRPSHGAARVLGREFHVLRDVSWRCFVGLDKRRSFDHKFIKYPRWSRKKIIQLYTLRVCLLFDFHFICLQASTVVLPKHLEISRTNWRV